MPRKPKPKNILSAGERAKLYEAVLEEKQKRLSVEAGNLESEDLDPSPSKVNLQAKNKRTVNLPKPSHATVNVNFGISVGEIKPVHGMCNGPMSYGADLSPLFSEIGVPYVRFDGANGPISACAVDLSAVFPDPEADPFEEASYDFSLTDRYVEAALRTGAQIIYRLGESYDLLGVVKKRSWLDREKLIQAAVKVIDHYNDYFAGGYSSKIRYFELWSAEDAADAELQDTFALYGKLSQAVKLHDGSLKVGGMCFCGLDKSAREFLRYCSKNALPLDFISLSFFASDPAQIEEQTLRTLGYLQNTGHGETEILIGKWCYLDAEALENLTARQALCGESEKAATARARIFRSQGSVKAAAFAAATLASLCRMDGVLTACYYDTQPVISPFGGLCDRFGDKQKPFHAFRAFSMLYRARNAVYCVSEQKEGYAHSGIYAAASLSEKDEGYILVASFGGCGTVDLRLDDIPERFMTAEISFLDGVKDLVPGASAPLSGMKKRMVLNLGEYSVALVKLY